MFSPAQQMVDSVPGLSSPVLAAAPPDQSFSRGEIRWPRPGVSEQSRARLDTFAPSHLSRASGQAASDSEPPSHRGLGSDPETGLRASEDVRFSLWASSDPGRSPRPSRIDGVSVSAGRLERKVREEATLGTVYGEVGGPR